VKLRRMLNIMLRILNIIIIMIMITAVNNVM
jgi:hypothetical protein